MHISHTQGDPGYDNMPVLARKSTSRLSRKARDKLNFFPNKPAAHTRIYSSKLYTQTSLLMYLTTREFSRLAKNPSSFALKPTTAPAKFPCLKSSQQNPLTRLISQVNSHELRPSVYKQLTNAVYGFFESKFILTRFLLPHFSHQSHRLASLPIDTHQSTSY